MTDLKVVPIHDGPNINDIPAQLRAFADRIERGEYGEVDGLFAILPRDKEYPVTLGWGVIDGSFDPIIQFDLARQWMVRAAAGLEIV
jgi:hypothetical protein